MKSDWERQKYLLLIIPKYNSNFIGYYDKILQTYNDIICKIRKYQKIHIISHNPNKLSKKYSKYKNIKISYQDYDDIWARDIMPIQTKNNIINFSFNAWGKKYPYKKDNALAKKLFPKSKKNKIILEGGAIESNGDIAIGVQDTFFKNRNNIKKEILVKKLKKLLELKEIYLLNNIYIDGDDTDGHIDNIIRFVNKNTIIYLQDKTNHSLKNMEKELIKIKEKYNFKEIIPLPLIKKYFMGKSLIASYLNFIHLNKVILIPKFNCSYDKKAYKIFKELFKKHFKDKKIISIDSRYLIREHGGLHCASYQSY